MTRVFILAGAEHEDIEDVLDAVHNCPRENHSHYTGHFQRPNGTYATKTENDDPLTEIWGRVKAAGFYPVSKTAKADGIVIPILVINAAQRAMVLNR